MITTIRTEKPNGEKVDRNLDAGQNPPNGVIVHYSLKEEPRGEVKLAFLDTEGKEIITFSSVKGQEEPTTDEGEQQEQVAAEDLPEVKTEERDKEKLRVLKEAGSNRFVWNMRYPEATKVEGYVGGEGALAGPVVPPGTYQVCLTVDDSTLTETFKIEKDPQIPATQEDLEALFDLRRKIWEKLSQTHEAINMIRSIRAQVQEWQRRTKGQKDYEAIANAAKPVLEKLPPIEEELIQLKAKTRQDTLNHPAKLNAKLAALGGVVASALAAPTQQEYELFDDLSRRVDEQIQRLQEVIDTDVATFNAAVKEAGVAAIIPSTEM
jgi:hypothetical protein